mmetsp:Transcript_27954/g.90137  ORF Transcript_27954/g.90137 Transcript_27954/m.90137 type:complete len:206 (-) Transcript_27954:69-686(-)
MDGIAANVVALLGAVEGDGLGEQSDAGLGGVVGGHVGPGDDARDRRYVYDRTADVARMPLHLSHAQLAPEERAVEVDVVDPPPFAEVRILHRLRRSDAGRVHEHVERAVVGDGVANGRGPLLFAPDVELHEALPEVVGHRATSDNVDVAEHDTRSFLDHEPGASRAEASGGAGHEGDLPSKAAHHSVFFPATRVDRQTPSSFASC